MGTRRDQPQGLRVHLSPAPTCQPFPVFPYLGAQTPALSSPPRPGPWARSPPSHLLVQPEAAGARPRRGPSWAGAEGPRAGDRTLWHCAAVLSGSLTTESPPSCPAFPQLWPLPLPAPEPGRLPEGPTKGVRAGLSRLSPSVTKPQAPGDGLWWGRPCLRKAI